MAYLAQLPVNLKSEFARGNNNKAAFWHLLQPLNHGNPEGERLSGSRLGYAHHVFPLDCDGNCLGLNWGGIREFEAPKYSQKSRGNAQAVKTGVCNMMMDTILHDLCNVPQNKEYIKLPFSFPAYFLHMNADSVPRFDLNVKEKNGAMFTHVQ